MKAPPRRLIGFLAGMVLLALALGIGRARRAPDLQTPTRTLFPEADRIVEQEGVLHAYDRSGVLLGWTGPGSAEGYGGPLLLVVGIDTAGLVVGAEVVEQRETPVFWRMVRAQEYLTGIRGAPYDAVPFAYRDVVSVTGATVSADAIVESVRASVSDVAGIAFDVRLPLPPRPFEFGFLEVTILGLFAIGIASHRARGPTRSHLRWGSQILGLLVLGFWENSPVTLAKITAFAAGFLPDPRTGAAIYLLLAGFVITSALYGRNLYCLFLCPFGAAQRLVGAIGGFRLKIEPKVARAMETVRDLIVFSAMFMALISLQPAMASYEPFAALFALHGTTLQWFLLFVVLTASLFLRLPWCNFFCPMRTVELVVLDTKRWLRDSTTRGPERGESGQRESGP